MDTDQAGRWAERRRRCCLLDVHRIGRDGAASRDAGGYQHSLQPLQHVPLRCSASVSVLSSRRLTNRRADCAADADKQQNPSAHR